MGYFQTQLLGSQGWQALKESEKAEAVQSREADQLLQKKKKKKEDEEDGCAESLAKGGREREACLQTGTWDPR